MADAVILQMLVTFALCRPKQVHRIRCSMYIYTQRGAPRRAHYCVQFLKRSTRYPILHSCSCNGSTSERSSKSWAGFVFSIYVCLIPKDVFNGIGAAKVPDILVVNIVTKPRDEKTKLISY